MASCANYWRYPGFNQGYFAPTYSQIRNIFYPTIEEVATKMGFVVDIKESSKEVHFYAGKQHRGTTICRSLDRPNTIIGFRIAHALVDELDVLPIDKARNSWRKIIARMRYPNAPNSVDVTTTPEGFRFTHEQFVKQVQSEPERTKRYGIVQASTYDNEKNLPPDYIPSLIEAYPRELIEAYINGQFVNLTSGTVYRSFCRQACDSTETIKPGDVLHIGMDFNIMKMAACVFVQRPDGFHCVDELKDVFDTPDMIQIIKERWHDGGHRVIIYPDATGRNREAVDASKSDISLLQQARFSVRVGSRNPAVKDRVLSVNKAFELGDVKVNVSRCPVTTECLEQQSYSANGDPDKTSGKDHQNDAFGYFTSYTFPINKPQTRMFTTSSR